MSRTVVFSLLVFVFHVVAWSQSGVFGLYYKSLKYSDSEFAGYCWGQWSALEDPLNRWVQGEKRGLLGIDDSLRNPKFVGAELTLNAFEKAKKGVQVELKLEWKNILTGDLLKRVEKKDYVKFTKESELQRFLILEAMPWSKENLLVQESPLSKWCDEAGIWMLEQKKDLFAIE